VTRSIAPLVPRVKVWLERDSRYVFGLGICEILEAVGRTGSIKQAAASLGRSYRHVWARIKGAEAALGGTLVVTRVGGSGPQRSFLTGEARGLIAAFSDLRTALFEIVEAEFARRFPPGTGATPS
jgi:molybdate transport system regulatory protein